MAGNARAQQVDRGEEEEEKEDEAEDRRSRRDISVAGGCRGEASPVVSGSRGESHVQEGMGAADTNDRYRRTKGCK
jgi:hypothetical protein